MVVSVNQSTSTADAVVRPWSAETLLEEQWNVTPCRVGPSSKEEFVGTREKQGLTEGSPPSKPDPYFKSLSCQAGI